MRFELDFQLDLSSIFRLKMDELFEQEFKDRAAPHETDLHHVVQPVQEGADVRQDLREGLGLSLSLSLSLLPLFRLKIDLFARRSGTIESTSSW